MHQSEKAGILKHGDFRPWWGWLTISLFGIFQFVLQGSIGMLSPGIKESFQVDATAISILSSSFFYSYILMQIPVGMFYDNFKIRTVATAALTVVALGCVLIACAPSLSFAIYARILIGLGCSFGFIGVLFCTKQWFPPQRFAFISGLAECFSMAGTGFANLVLSEVTKILGWRGALSICGIAGIILALSVWTLLTSAHRYRYQGQLREQGTPPKPNRRRLWQSMQVVLATKEMWLGGVFSACTFSVLSAFVGLWGVPFLMLKYDLDVVGVTSVLAMVYLGVGASSPLLGWLASRVRMRLLMTVGTALCFVSLLFVLYSPNLPLWMLYILMFKLGFTCSVYQLSFTLVCQSVPDYCQGVAIGTTNMITMISAPVLQPIIGIFLSMSHGSILDGFETYSLASYQKALLVLPIVYALGFVIAFFFKEKLSGDNEQLPEANYSGH